MPREVADRLKETGEWRGGDEPAALQCSLCDRMIAEFGAFALALALALALLQAGGVRRGPSAALAGAGRGGAGGGVRLDGRGGGGLRRPDLRLRGVGLLGRQRGGQLPHRQAAALPGGRGLGQPRGLDAAVVPGPDRLRRRAGAGTRPAVRAEDLGGGGAGRAGRPVPGLHGVRLQPVRAAGPGAGGGALAQPAAAGPGAGDPSAVPLRWATSGFRWSSRWRWRP